MNRKRKEIKEEIVGKYISRSMMAYPSDKSITPLIFHIDTSRIIEDTSIEQYDDQTIKCRLCGSFFNPYCQINDSSINWRCSVCYSVNQLPLPPSDSIFTPYSIAKNLTCYNNAVFDFIPPHLPITNHQKPKIIISIQSCIYNDVKNILFQSLKDNDLFSYAFTIFDSSIQIFNFHLKSWHIISDFANDNSFFLPTKKEFLFGNSSELKNALSTDNNFSSNENQNIENVFHFVNCFQNAKLLLILKYPILTSPPSFSFPASVVFYESTNTFSSMENLLQWSNSISADFFYFKTHYNSQATITQNISYSRLINFLSKSLITPFKTEIKVVFRAPKLFEINQEKEDYHLFTVSRRQSSVAQILSFAQFEISFKDCMRDEISIFRYINVKIPLSPDPRVFRSATFPNPLQHLCVASRYILSRLRNFIILEHETILLKLQNQLMEISYQFPLTDSFWPHFIYQLLNSDFLRDSQNFNKIHSILFKYKNMPPQICLLHFLPFQFVNDKLIPLFPKENKEAVARVTENVIFVAKNNDTASIAQKICTLLDIDDLKLPVVEVESFEEAKDEEALFDRWKHNFELSRYNYMENKKKKSK